MARIAYGTSKLIPYEHLLPNALRSKNERPSETIAAMEISRAASRMKFRFELQEAK